MNDPRAFPGAIAEGSSDKPATFRLVIRAKIISEETTPTAPALSPRRTLALVAAGVAALLALGWLGISVFGGDPPAASESARSEKVQALASTPPPVTAAGVDVESLNRPLTKPTSSAPPAEASSTMAESVQPAAPAGRATSSPSPIDQIVPNTPRSALQTIRGTIRVLVQVTVNQQGMVIAATSVEPGPSRYFERLALEAARKWTFAPTATQEPHQLRLQFNFTRERASARVRQ